MIITYNPDVVFFYQESMKAPIELNRGIDLKIEIED